MSIRIDSLTKKFKDHVLFESLNFDITFNETTVLTGCSGCGKTTLLRIIAGLDKDYYGSVSGVPKKISFMFQEDRLLPWRNVTDNIAFVLKDMMPESEIGLLVQRMIKDVQLDGHENKFPGKLSGGMKRRVAMARAFCYPGDLLLMDEPFKGFDKKLKLDMINLFEDLFIKTNRTAILVTHTAILVTHDETAINHFKCNIVDIEKLNACNTSAQHT